MAARAMGIHTAVETNGHYGAKLSDAELEAIDLVLLDIKTWDSERHRPADRHDQRCHAGVRGAAGG